MAGSVDGQVMIVTGASAGIGKATAIELARRGAHVVLVCRDQARGEAARHEAQASSASTRADLLLADLSSQVSIRRLAEEIQRLHPTARVLINNAGVARSTRTLTPDGIEVTFAVNYLAPFLLTNLLLGTLAANKPARVLNVTSTRMAPRLEFDNLQGEKQYSLTGAYDSSKLAMTMFTYELARRLEGTGVTANCVHPGGVRTQIYGDLRGVAGMLFPLVLPFLTSPERGARTSVWAATAPDLDGVSGAYFADCRARRSTPASYEVATAARLWALSERLVGLPSGGSNPR
jgi:retinol dehydrogenase-14